MTPKEREFCENSVHPLVVHLVLTYHWFDEMVNLRKHVEYRAMTPHWKRLIWDRRNKIAAARFSRGYTAETIVRPVIGIDVGPCPYNGWDGDYYRLTLGLITEHNAAGQGRREAPYPEPDGSAFDSEEPDDREERCDSCGETSRCLMNGLCPMCYELNGGTHD